MKTLSAQDIRDILNGVHSNIPACCIAYFVDTWLGFTTEQRQRRLNQLKDRLYRMGIRPRVEVVGNRVRWLETGCWNYVPCERCEETGNRVQIHECTTACIPFLRQVYGTNYLFEYLTEPTSKEKWFTIDTPEEMETVLAINKDDQ